VRRLAIPVGLHKTMDSSLRGNWAADAITEADLAASR
jgi:hypothetical protein